MKIKRNAVIIGLACVFAANVAALRAQPTSGEKVKGDVKQTVNDVKTDVGEKKAEYEKWAKAQLDEMDAKIDQLTKKMSELSQDGKAKATVQAKELRKKRKAAGKKFKKMKAASKKEWEAFRVEVDDAVSNLKKAYEDLQADLK